MFINTIGNALPIIRKLEKNKVGACCLILVLALLTNIMGDALPIIRKLERDKSGA